MENPNYNDLKNNVLDNNSHWMIMQSLLLDFLKNKNQ